METENPGQAVYIPYTGREVKSARPSNKWAVPYEEWRDDAVCDGMDPSLFELTDNIRTLTEGEREDEEARIAEGLKICSRCPVRQECRTNANASDKYWSTRGGQPPEGLFLDAKMPRFATGSNGREGGFRPGEGPVRKLKEECKNGHKDGWKAKADGRRFCGTCATERDRRRWKKNQ
jgi:transcription factor WhiB